MNRRLVIAVGIVVIALTVTLFAVEKPATASVPRMIRLKANGKVIAELRLLSDTTMEVVSQSSSLNRNTGAWTAAGGVTLHLRQDGGQPVVVKADEIETASESK